MRIPDTLVRFKFSFSNGKRGFDTWVSLYFILISPGFIELKRDTDQYQTRGLERRTFPTLLVVKGGQLC